jgi:MscS family membrane protein
MTQLQALLEKYATHPLYAPGLIVVTTLLAMAATRLVVMPVLRRAASRLRGEADDLIVDRLSPALQWTIVLLGLEKLAALALPADKPAWLASTTATLVLWVWLRFALQVGQIVYRAVHNGAPRYRWIQPASLPLFQFVYKVVLLGIGSYLLMASWHVNLTSWLASAGVAGIAVGFAAKDTLANFISGVFILMDAPYKVGDVIIIDDVTRGEVTDIGMRSTRLLTVDNVEVTVPNAVIGNAKIVNESSGPTLQMRVRTTVGVTYGSDVDRVRDVLMEAAKGIPHVSPNEEPIVRFSAMGESSLDFTVLVLADNPRQRALVADELNTRIYKALGAAGIEIPFPQRDLHIKSWPSPPPAEAAAD